MIALALALAGLLLAGFAALAGLVLRERLRPFGGGRRRRMMIERDAALLERGEPIMPVGVPEDVRRRVLPPKKGEELPEGEDDEA